MLVLVEYGGLDTESHPPRARNCLPGEDLAVIFVAVQSKANAVRRPHDCKDRSDHACPRRTRHVGCQSVQTTRVTRQHHGESYSYKQRLLDVLFREGRYPEYLANYIDMSDPQDGPEAAKRFEFITKNLVAPLMPRESASRVVRENAKDAPKTLAEIETELIELEITEREVRARLEYAQQTRIEAASAIEGSEIARG